MNITTRTIASSMLALTLQAGVTAVFPATVLASEASDEAAKAISRPLSAKNYATERTIVNLAALDTLGQSDGVAQTFHNIALETYRITTFPKKDDNSLVPRKPLDW